jgi:hypothetical protein
MPENGELFGRVVKLVGGDIIIVKCNDGKVITCRVLGKIKRIMWIRDKYWLLHGTFSPAKLILFRDILQLMQTD